MINNKNEEATQSANIAGPISVFGNEANNHFIYDDWYKQLFELKDFEDTNLDLEELNIIDIFKENDLIFLEMSNNIYGIITSEYICIGKNDYKEIYLTYDEAEINWLDYDNQLIIYRNNPQYDYLLNKINELN